MPVVDVRETGDAYILEMELPGYDEKCIEVHIENSKLSISSKRESKDDDDKAGVYLIKERRFNPFSRTFKLPKSANPELIKASFKNGVLCLEIKKSSEGIKRAVLINAA